MLLELLTYVVRLGWFGLWRIQGCVMNNSRAVIKDNWDVRRHTSRFLHCQRCRAVDEIFTCIMKIIQTKGELWWDYVWYARTPKLCSKCCLFLFIVILLFPRLPFSNENFSFFIFLIYSRFWRFPFFYTQIYLAIGV